MTGKSRWLGVIGVCACGAPQTSVEIARPIPSASAAPLPHESAPAHAAPIHASGEAPWARAFPKEKTFETISLADAARVVFTWHRGATHAVKSLPPSEDYPGNHVAAVILRVNEHAVALGDLPGDPWPMQLTYCKNLGWHFAAKSAWGFPNEPSVVSAYSVAIMQGNDDFLVLRDGATLHVLHRQTSDGSCQEAKQGPLDVCKDFEWKRRAELHVGTARDLSERVVQEDAAYDCSVEYYGEKLAPP